MKTVTLDVPELLDERDIRMAIAALLFDRADFSSGQAAEYVGISKREFLETVGRYGVSIFGETAEDLAKPL